MTCVRAALESGRLATVEYRLRTHLGEERDFEVRIAPASEDEVVAIVRDVTDLHDATRELKESRARIVAAGDAERRRVERNLHDGAQQRLVTVALHLQLIRRKLETDSERGAGTGRGGTDRADARAGGDPRARPRLASAPARRPRARPCARGSCRARRAPGGDRGAAVRAAAGCRRGGGVLHHRGSPRECRQAQPRLARDRERLRRRRYDCGRGRRRRRRRRRSRSRNRAARPCRPGRCPRRRAGRLERCPSSGTALRAELPHD